MFHALWNRRDHFFLFVSYLVNNKKKLTKQKQKGQQIII